MADIVDDILAAAAQHARGPVSGMQDIGFDEVVEGLVNVGALTDVGAHKLKQAHRMTGGATTTLPSPAFQRSERSTERRAPLGMVEDGSAATFFTAPAGGTTTMRGKVSRVTHVDRLLIVPSAPGVVLQSVKVGDEEQLLASGAPVELYGPTALTDTIPDNFSPLGPGLDFIVTLLNTTGAPITGTIGCKASCKR